MRILNSVIALCALLFVGVAGWQIGGKLSSDAVGMALGVLFGIMAGIPASLMVLAAKRRDDFDYDEPTRRWREQYTQVPQNPPIIVVTGQGRQQAQPTYQEQPVINGQLTGPNAQRPHRNFRVVGETEQVYGSW